MYVMYIYIYTPMSLCTKCISILLAIHLIHLCKYWTHQVLYWERLHSLTYIGENLGVERTIYCSFGKTIYKHRK